MKNILCYGDSNTWGYVPGSLDRQILYSERYPRNVRWTGLLQQSLGKDYYVIEEGLNGRTTDIDQRNFPGRNGKTYLGPCLSSHSPLDLVILFLGVNDLKVEFNRSIEDVTNGMDTLIRVLKTSIYGPDMQNPPKILLIGYPIIVHEDFISATGEKVLKGAIEKSKQLPKAYQQLAKQQGCYYFDAAPHIELSAIDGIHFDEKCHREFAKLMSNEVKNIFLNEKITS